MRRDRDSPDERFAAYVHERGERHLRVAVLLSPPPAGVTCTPPA